MILFKNEVGRENILFPSGLLVERSGSQKISIFHTSTGQVAHSFEYSEEKECDEAWKQFKKGLDEVSGQKPNNTSKSGSSSTKK